MNEVKNFYKDNVLEIMFLVGVVGLCVVYWLCMTDSSVVPQAKFLYSASVFIGEFIWFLAMCYYAKKLDTFAKLIPLSLLAIVCLVIICSYLSYAYVPHWELVVFIALVGLVSFGFSLLVIVAAIKAKGLRNDTEN